jgi:hypothetical protein
LKEGKVVDFKTFPKRIYTNHNKATVNRVFKKWPNHVAYDDGGYTCWTDDGGPISYREKTTEEVFKLKDKHILEDIGTSLKQLLGDVEDVYVWVHPKNRKDDNKYDLKDSKNRYFLVYGNVEVVSTFNGTVRDIYFHNKEEFDPEDIWKPIVDEKEATPTAIAEVGSEALFLRDSWQTSMLVGDIPLVKRGNIDSASTIKKPASIVPIHQNVRGHKIYVGSGTGDTFSKREYYRSNANPNYVFALDRVCTQHKVLYTLHVNPQNCDECGSEAAQTVLDFESINEIVQVYNVKVGYNNWSAIHEHKWMVSDYGAVDAPEDLYGAYWAVPAKEKCVLPGCNTERYLAEFAWMLKGESNTISS